MHAPTFRLHGKSSGNRRFRSVTTLNQAKGLEEGGAVEMEGEEKGEVCLEETVESPGSRVQ